MKETFGKRLREMRLNRDLSQLQLALMSNISRQNIANYEEGTHTPDINIAGEIARILKVSTDYLIGISDDCCINDAQHEYEKLYEEYEAYKKRVDRAVEKTTISLNGSIIDLNDLTR